MKRFMISLLILTAGAASAQVHVNGYTKKDGTYVAPHERTAPNTPSNPYAVPQIQPLSTPSQPTQPQSIWGQPKTK